MAAHSLSPKAFNEGNPSASMAWFKRGVTRLQHRLAWQHDYRSTFRELSALSDRELDDIGVARCDVRLIARQSADRTAAVRW